MAERPSSEPGTPAPRTVLVVDDDPEVQRFLGERLEAHGFRVMVERDGDWALRTFERRRIDAVVLDILIPVVNGFQVAERIRLSPRGRDVAIVMLTGIYRGPRHRQEAIERYGLLDYLDKPLEVERLVTLLVSHFAGLPAPPPATPTPRPGSAALVDEQQRREKRDVERAARAVEDGKAELRGNLKRVPFPRLLARLHREKRSGGLFLLRDKIKKIIYFRGGHPSFIKSNVLDECLGRVLVRERMISEAECEESVRRMKQQKRQQGSVLIEMGVISPHNLRYGLELQLQVKLFEIFDWREGEYVFREDVPLPAETIGLEMSAAQIVLEGVKRAYHHDRLDAAIAPILDRYPELAPDPERRFQALPLAPVELELVHRFDGTRKLADALARPPAGLDAHGARALTLALEAMGVIELRDRPGSGRTVPPLPPPEAVPEALEVHDTVPTFRADAGPAGATDGALSDAELGTFLADRRGADAYRVLDVTPETASADVDRAYGQLLRELHPDRFRGRPEGTLALASEAFELVERAHEALAEPRSRRAAAAAFRNASPPALPPVEQLIDDATSPAAPSSDTAARTLAADRIFRAGEIRLRAREFADAERLFRQAVDLRPDMGLYHAYLGWALFCHHGQTAAAAEEALPVLHTAIELAPALEHPHLFLGLVRARIDQPDLAEPELEKAVQCNPDSGEALRELRLIHMKRRA